MNVVGSDELRRCLTAALERLERIDVDELMVPGERGERRHRELSASGGVPLAAPA